MKVSSLTVGHNVRRTQITRISRYGSRDYRLKRDNDVEKPFYWSTKNGAHTACVTTTSSVIGQLTVISDTVPTKMVSVRRKHCANRVHRLRSSLKMTHGKGKEFKKLPPVDPEKLSSSQYVKRFHFMK